MRRPTKPVKVVLTASVALVASQALQGTTTEARAKPEDQWRAVQQSIENQARTQADETGQLRVAVDPPLQPYSSPPTSPTPMRPHPPSRLMMSTVKHHKRHPRSSNLMNEPKPPPHPGGKSQ